VKRTKCVQSASVSARCSICRAYVVGVHIVGEALAQLALYCAACCPCGRGIQ
jgi:hypothetical protein